MIGADQGLTLADRAGIAVLTAILILAVATLAAIAAAAAGVLPDGPGIAPETAALALAVITVVAVPLVLSAPARVRARLGQEIEDATRRASGRS